MSSAAPAPGEEPILVELAAAGFETRSLADLRRSGARYRDAIPVLLGWLSRVTDPKVKGEIVRALSVPWAKPTATGPLIEEFREVDASVDPTGTGLRWTIGNALEVLFDDARFEAVWTVPASVDSVVDCPIRRETSGWVRHVVGSPRSTSPRR